MNARLRKVVKEEIKRWHKEIEILRETPIGHKAEGTGHEAQ